MKSQYATICERHSNDLNKVNLSLISKNIADADFLHEKGASFAEIMESLSLACNDKSFIHPQWSLLSGRLYMEIIHYDTKSSFSEAMKSMATILNPEFYTFVCENAQELDEMIREDNDFHFNIFSAKTLRKSYLAHLKINDKAIIVERPQYMYLRVAAYLHFPDMRKIEKVYTSLSNGSYSHASPTLFHAGMRKPQMSSCFLSTIEDTMSEITKSWHDQAIISMNSGGLGYDFSQIRHSEIGQHGFSRGVIPWLKITNEILSTVDQSGKRKGSGTVYLRDWHIDIFEFVELRDEGPEDMRAKHLFLGIMVSDLFMQRVLNDEMWSLFCPNKVKGMTDKWGADFEMRYIVAEREKLYSRQIKARDLWNHILKMQIKKGMPFILYMDPCNMKSNQKHSGTIRSSNLCCEILEVTNKDEIASCILGSICLNKCVEYDSQKGKMFFNFDKLEESSRELVQNLNNLIDRNFYPEEVPQIKYSNMKHRPIAIGIQGLADAFALLDIAWVKPVDNKYQYDVSEEAKKLNDQIFETIYFAAVRESVELAKISGPYESFPGSPTSKGYFQFDLWEQERRERSLPKEFSADTISKKSVKKSRYTTNQWEALRSDMKKYGLRNSLLTAIMPTASSAHILGNGEAAEPFTDLIYSRTVLSGQFMIVNKHMVKDLEDIDMWTTETIQNIVLNRGSMSNLSLDKESKNYDRLEFLKLKYKTVYEIPQRVIVDLAADRAEFIDQTQSQNCHMERPTKEKLNAYHFYCWQKRLKTGMYYCRQKALTDAINISVNNIVIPTSRKNRKIVCTDEICTSCTA